MTLVLERSCSHRTVLSVAGRVGSIPGMGIRATVPFAVKTWVGHLVNARRAKQAGGAPSRLQLQRIGPAQALTWIPPQTIWVGVQAMKRQDRGVPTFRCPATTRLGSACCLIRPTMLLTNPADRATSSILRMPVGQAFLVSPQACYRRSSPPWKAAPTKRHSQAASPATTPQNRHPYFFRAHPAARPSRSFRLWTRKPLKPNRS